jgi:hypothetical protein
MRIAALICLLAAGCASQSGRPAEDYAVGGQLNLGRGQILVTINGEEVVQGPLRLQGGFLPFGPGRPAPSLFPLQGSYHGQPVEVECYKQPVIGDPICYVELSGQRISTLLFDPEGRAGVTAAEDR